MSIIEKAVDKIRKVDRDEGLGDPDIPSDVERQVQGTDAEDQSLPGREMPAPHGRARPANFVELPVEALKQKGMITLDKPRSQIAESYRMIKRPLLTNIGGNSATAIDRSNLIMVTSSLQGEGKTFTALNLAMSMSMEQEKTVLFLDVDFSQASASKLLGIPANSPGIIDVLQHPDIDIGDVLFDTDIPNLRVVPAGNLHDRSTEMLASDAMKDLMVEVSARYPDRVVIFDSPPLLLTTEATVLVKLVGQVVFVVAAEQTSKPVISDALEHIGRDKAIGMVLNKAQSYPLDRLVYGYGYGYRYGYNDGYGQNRPDNIKTNGERE